MNVINKDLSEAITHGDLEKVKDLIKHNGLYKSGVYGYYVLLRKSIKLKHTEITKLLFISEFNENRKRMKRSSKHTPLHFAVLDDDLEIIKILLDHGANINARNECGSSPLVSAIHMDKGKIVDLLLRGSANSQCNNNGSSIHLATEQVLYNISEQFSSVNSKTRKGLSPMHFATTNQNEKTIAWSSGNNVDVKARTNNLITTLHLVLRNCHREYFKFLKDNRNKINFRFKTRKNPLKCEVCKCFSMLLEDILNNCQSNKHSTKNNATTCPKNNLKIVENLFKYSFPFDDIHKNVLRFNALKMLYIDVIHECIKHYGIDLAYDKEQHIMLHIVTKNKQVEIAKLMFTHTPDFNATGRSKNRLILYSKENPDANITKVLLLHGCCSFPYFLACTYTKNCTNNVIDVFYEYTYDAYCFFKDYTPLQMAVYRGNIKNIEMLLDNGVDVNSKQENGDTALHIATRKCRADILKILLKYGADVHSKNEVDATPLHLASKETHPEIVSILLQNGSPVSSKDMFGGTCLEIAIDYSRSENVILLLKYGSDISNSNMYVAYVKTYATFGLRPNLRKINKKVEVLRILKYHLIMLKCANLYYNKEQDQSFLSRLADDDDDEDEDFTISKKLHMELCENEIKELKLEKIANNKLSFYDILRINNQSLARYTTNEEIVQILKSDHYKTKFPIYTPILERVLKRCLLYKRAQEFFYFQFKLPHHCSEEIFQYLNADDMERLMYNITQIY